MVVHAMLPVHKTVTVGANLQFLMYNLLIAIVFSTYQLTLKKISQGYAEQKGFSCFN